MTPENNAKTADIKLHLRSDRKHVLVPDLEEDFTEQMLRVKDSETEDLMRQAFEGTPEGEELGFGFVGEADAPEVVKAGMFPEPEGITTAQALGQVLVGGPTDALKNAATNITQAGEDVRQYQLGDKTVQQHLEDADRFLGTENFFGDINAGGLLSGRVDVPVGEFGKQGGSGVQALRGLAGYLAALTFMRGAGAGTTSAGAMADAFFIDNEQNLSNLFNEFVPEGSPFRNPITDYLEAKTDDSVVRLFKGMRGKVEPQKPLGEVQEARPISDMQTRIRFDDQDFDISAMQLPFESINNEKIIKKISSELDERIKKSTLETGDLKTGKKGREIEFQAKVEKQAREKFFADPEGETKRLLELDPGKTLNRVDQLEFGLVKQASLKRIDDLANLGDEKSATVAMEQFRFHVNVILEQSERFSETAGRELGIRKRLKKGDLGQGRKMQSVADQVQRKVDPNMTPLAFAQKWRETSPEEWVSETRRLGGMDMLFEAWVNSLFGLKTHVVNTLGNIANLSLQTVERQVAAQLRRTKRAFGASPNGVTEGEAMDMLYGMVTSQPHNFRVLAKNLGKILIGKEIPASQFQKLEQANIRAIKGKNTGFKEGSFMYQGVDVAGHIMSSQGKLLLTMDEYFKMTGYTAAIRAEARRVAVSEGKTGKALASRIAQLIDQPSATIKANAENFADYATFTKELGEVGKSMHAFIHKTPFGRYVVPFHNVLVNIAKFSGERTPLAVFSKKIRADLAAGGARADLAQARMATGTAASMGFLSLALGDGLTGKGPQNAKMNEAWRRKGNQPYSVVLMSKDGKKRLTMSQHFLSQTFASSVSDFLGLFDEGKSRFFENLGSTAVPFGGVFRDIEKTVDPTLRDTRTVDPKFMRNEFKKQFGNEMGDSLADSAEVLFRMLQKARANVPGYSEDLPARLNMWGDVVAYEKGVGFDPLSPFFIQTEKDSPLDDWLIELQVPVGLPEPVIAGGDPENPVALNPQQYHDYVILAGLPAFEELDKYVRTQEFKQRKDGAKASYLEGKIRMYRAKAARALPTLKNDDGSLKYPDLAALLSQDVIRARQEIVNRKKKKVTLTPRN